MSADVLPRRVVRVLWHSSDGGRTWRPVDVLAGSPLSGGVSHQPDSWWSDGWGNCYRNAPPAAASGTEGDTQ